MQRPDAPEDGSAVAAALRGHADGLEALRHRLEAVRFTSTFMARDDLTYGSLCAWLGEFIEERFERQDELLDFVMENFRKAAVRLRLSADAYDGSPGAPDRDEVARAAYWAPEGSSTPVDEANPGPRLAQQIQPLVDRIANLSWADDRLTALAADPVAATEVDAVLADFAPMRELAAKLAGRPQVVADQTRAWYETSVQMHRVADALERHLDREMPEWTGEAHASYKALMDKNVDALGGTAATAAALAAAVDGAGAVIAAALRLVREQGAALAANLTAWAAAREVSGDPLPQQLVAAIAKWALTVAAHLNALARSLQSLKGLLGK